MSPNPLSPDDSSDLISFTREEVFEKVQEGSLWIVFKGKVYDVTKWISYHPGGELSIRHMVGKDATDQIVAMHPAWMIEKKLPKFCIGKLSFSDKPLYQIPTMGDTSAADLQNFGRNSLSKSYLELENKLQREGYFETDYHFYYQKVALFAFLYVVVWSLVLFGGGSTIALFSSALVLAALWHQVAFMAHDAGHNGITHDSYKDTMIGIGLGNFLGGLSLGWWKHSHNVHHIVTNHPEHDPDIQHLPFFAVSTRFFQNLYSTYYQQTMRFDKFAEILVSMQHYLYYPLLLFGRFNLYANSWNYLLSPKVPYRKQEIIGMIFFWSWFSLLLSFMPSYFMMLCYIFLSHAFTFILHAQITLSHFSMSTEDFGDHEAFVKHQLRTTIDVDCPEWLDWFHGGLQFQVIHHLFPRAPRHNLRKVKPFVEQFAKENGLKYQCVTFTKGSNMVLSTLKQVADQIGIVVKVAVNNPESHAHK